MSAIGYAQTPAFEVPGSNVEMFVVDDAKKNPIEN